MTGIGRFHQNWKTGRKIRGRAWHRSVLTLAIAGLLSAVLAGAAAAQGSRLPAPSGSQEEPYRVGKGDVIRVDVPGHTDMSGSFTVADDGTVTVPNLGTIRVQGRTASEIRSDLGRRVSLIDRSSPPVTVTVAEFKSRKIFVLGAVLLPGIYAFAEMPTVWDAIAEAGGPLDDANLNAVELIPGDAAGGRKTETIDIASAIRESRTETLPRLRPGDTVRVPRGQNATSVLLTGAVLRPGPLPYDQAPDLVTAVVRSGGVAADADQNQVQVIRQSGDRSMRIRVNLNKYFEKGDASSNPHLEPGDTVFIPRKEGTSIWVHLAQMSSVISLVASIIALSRH
ncbi:MAG TPA: polysaccharide biosynthesis/export family protein [Candidatus Binatia bacterium]|nr:polysaccharide biosynthesis/export family protein [Candidatus Binatia bacterium]